MINSLRDSWCIRFGFTHYFHSLQKAFFATFFFLLRYYSCVWEKHIKIYLQSWGRFIGSWKQGNTSISTVSCVCYGLQAWNGKKLLSKLIFMASQKIIIYCSYLPSYNLVWKKDKKKQRETKQTIISAKNTI